MRRLSKLLAGIGLAVAIALSAAGAGAALTDTEKDQVRDYYSKADAAAAGRLRALLARPDLAPAEAGAAFSDAARRARFDERRLAFLRSLLFGPATQASRSDLVPPVVAGLLARSAEVAGGRAADALRAEEIVRIHRFVAAEIAGAGEPPRTGHDASAGIRDDALRAAVQAYRAHLSLPVFERGRIRGALRAGRAQAEIALVELASGLFPPADVASWIGAGAAEREAFEKTGVVVFGLDAAPAAKSAAIVAFLAAAGPAARGASALWIGKPWPRGLAARRAVLVAQAPLGGGRRADPLAIWPSSVEPSAPDAALAEVAFVLGRAGAAALAASDAAFAGAARQALARARAGGGAALLGLAARREADGPDAGAAAEQGAAEPAISEIGLVAHAARLLLIDAPRALAAALARSLAGRHEPVEQLALALGVLATREDGALSDRVVLGRTGEGGQIAPVEVTGIAGSAAAIARFVIDGQAYAIARGEDGAVREVTREGKPITLAGIPLARVPASAGEVWTPPAVRGARPAPALFRLSGRPEVGFAEAARFVVRSPGKGRHAAAVRAPGAQIEARLDVLPAHAPCAIVARATAGALEPAGVALLIEPGESPRAALAALDGTGASARLAGPIPLPKPGPTGYRVEITVRGDAIEVTVAGVALRAALPGTLAAGGDLAFLPGERGEIQVRDLQIGLWGSGSPRGGLRPKPSSTFGAPGRLTAPSAPNPR